MLINQSKSVGQVLRNKYLLIVIGCFVILSGSRMGFASPAPDLAKLKRLPVLTHEFEPPAMPPRIEDSNAKIPQPVIDRWSSRVQNNSSGQAQSPTIVPKKITLNSKQNVTNDAFQDYETSVVSVDLNGQTYVTTAFIKDYGNNIRKVHYYTTTASGTQSWKGFLPMGDMIKLSILI